MSKRFGPQRLDFQKSRKIDSSVTSRATPEFENAIKEDQIKADQIVLDLIGLETKNRAVLELAELIALKDSHVFIPVAPDDYTDRTKQVRRALIANYQKESEGGAIIRFELFKKIVDAARDSNQNPIQFITDLGNLEEGLNEINTGDLALLFNEARGITDYIKKNPNSEQSPEDEKEFWKLAGIAFASFFLLQQVQKSVKMHAAKDQTDRLKERNAEAIAAENELHKAQVNLISGLDPSKQAAASASENARHTAKIADLQIKKSFDLIQVLTEIAEVLVFFMLLHDLPKSQARSLANRALPKEVELDPSIKEQFYQQVETLYDNPTEEITSLIIPEDGDDEVILSWAMDYIDNHPEQNFDTWIVYAMATVRSLQIDAVLSASPTYSTVSEQARERRGAEVFRISPSKNFAAEQIARLNSPGRIEIRPIVNTKKLDTTVAGRENRFSTDKKIGVNITDYFYEVENFTDSANNSDNFLMELLLNNKYTPELVCCLLKYFGIDDLDFLKNLRNLLNAFAKGIGFDLNGLLEDIVKGLFRDLSVRMTSYLIAYIQAFFDKIIKAILDWLDRLKRDHEYIAFCTPIMDMAYALIRAINELRRLLEDLIRDLVAQITNFDIKFNFGFIGIHGRNRYRSLIDLLDALIFALERGQLCNLDEGDPGIDPDAIPIIDRLGLKFTDDGNIITDLENRRSQITIDGQDLVVNEKFYTFEPSIGNDEFTFKSVEELRKTDGKDMIETLVQYEKNCKLIQDDPSGKKQKYDIQGMISRMEERRRASNS